MCNFWRFPLTNTHFRVGPKVNSSYGFLTFSGLWGGGCWRLSISPVLGMKKRCSEQWLWHRFSPLSSFIALPFQKSKINSLDFLRTRQVWILWCLWICWECWDMKSYFNPKQRIRMKKNRIIWESVGIRAGYCITEIFHFRHKQHTALCGQKGLRETPGGLEK